MIAVASISFSSLATESEVKQQEEYRLEETNKQEVLELKEAGQQEISEAAEEDAQKEETAAEEVKQQEISNAVDSDQQKETESEVTESETIKFEEGQQDEVESEETGQQDEIDAAEEDAQQEEDELEEEDQQESSEIDKDEEESHYVEYYLETNAAGYDISLKAYDGVFPKDEVLSISATQIEDQKVLDAIDSKLSSVCEGEFKQISFDVKVLNASGEELQPDRSKYVEDEDIVPIQLTISLANDEPQGEIEVFHFADDLSSMECLVSTVEGDEVTVEPEHFSVFTILESNDGSYYSGLTAPTGYRTYIEWMPNSTAGLRRLQKIYVYAKKDEVISFGSSSFLNLPKAEVATSLKDSFGYGVGTPDGDASIAVTLPYDADVMQEKTGSGIYSIYGASSDPATVVSQIESSSYGNTNIYLFRKDKIDVETSTNVTAPGTIYNWQQEALGVKNASNPGGYTPISFKAPVTGVYTFRFFGTQYNKVVAATKVKKTDKFLQKSNNYVGAWDITVTENETATEPITGRTYTDALIWTIGANLGDGESVLNESVYALTKDGFEYKVDFNGIDPFGFVFYTNKRGLLVSSDDHEDGHYRSLARSVKSARNQLDDLIEMGVHINSTPTTDKDESYFLTFERADSELLKHYTNHSVLTGADDIGTKSTAYDNFKFRGLNSTEDHKGMEGYGGYFSFTYDRSAEDSGKILPSTYEIIMDFTGNATLESEYGYAPGTHNEVILSNTLVDGSNTIFWDGKDEHGNIVIGDDAGIDYTIVSFNVKAGEVHFPLLDVENNKNGIKVEMQNALSGVDKSKIYYDNSDSDVYGKNIGDKQEALTGVSSAGGAMAFKKNQGDCCAIDIWADYRVATPVENYTLTLTGIANDQAFIEAKTAWEYEYTTMDGHKHFDASATLPDTAEVVLQYRIVDKDTVKPGGIDKSSDDWQVNDTGAGKDWKNYEGDVKVNLQVDEVNSNIETITLDPASGATFDSASGTGIYGSVTIKSYRTEANTDPITSGIYPIEASEGLCIFSGLPLHPAGPDYSKFYQYRVVDKRVINKALLTGYDTEEIFDRDAAVDIQVTAGHVTKYVYLEEALDYKYRGAPTFNLEFDQFWNDTTMTTDWLADHKPKAVKVAVLYGIPLYEDVDTSTEYDITTETGYYGEEVDIVWRKIQLIDYLTLDQDGVSCTDSEGVTRKLSTLSEPDAPYAAYFPVGKYMSNGDPYFYKIRPISYSMDGVTFSDVEYWDVGHIVPKTSLPEFYGIDDDADDTVNKKFHVVFYDEDVAGSNVLYPNAVKFTDIPEKAEIEVTKTDEADNPITGKTTSYEITDKDGKSLMFICDSDGTYTYKGLEGDSGLPAEASKIIKTSSADSIVHADGLPLREYSVHEVEAPKGYALSTTSIDIIVPDFVAETTIIGGFKQYLCSRRQMNVKLKAKPGSAGPAAPGDSPENSSNSVVSAADIALGKEEIKALKKLPKTGGLVGSLFAVSLGAAMVGIGIYLTKPSKKKRGQGK